MRMHIPSLVLLTAVGVLDACGELRTIRDVRDFCQPTFEKRAREGFALEGQVLSTGSDCRQFILGDSHGNRLMFGISSTSCPQPGEIVRIRGKVSVERSLESSAYVTNLVVVGRQPIPPPPRLLLGSLDERLHDLTVVATEGTVIDCFTDEVDDAYTILLLKDGPTTLPVSTPKPDNSQYAFVDAQVRVTGVYFRSVQGTRKFSGPFIIGDKITLLRPPPVDFFDAPPLEAVIYRSPRDVASLGKRRIEGEVLACWDGCRLMVQERSGRIVNVLLSRPFEENPPANGAFIIAAGYPETDPFRINLAKARFRPASGTIPTNETPTRISTADILTAHGLRRGGDTYHGRLIRLNGIVRSLPADGAAERRLILDSGEFRVPVDFSSCPRADDGLVLGCTVEATGRCLLETDAWRTDHVLPRLRGFTVVLRTADDIRVLTRPSWWTPARLLTALCLLFAALAAILVWNILLRRLAEQRGRALFDAQIARAESELRVDERTRLAVELHDSISQNLTGASMRIDAARRCLDTSREKTLRNLDVASRTLDSCRAELRNCIWDLRNQALEATDMNEAIRTVLLPHVGDAELTIRFNIPRERLTDNTAHALMRIVRELAVNAVRHGSAKSIRIAGALEGGKLLFSVSDDGCGFYPEIRPGIADGHFGLEGVMERIRHFNGKMKIESSPGRGTRIAVSLDLPEGKQGTDNG